MAVAAETVTRSTRGIDVERFLAWVVNSIKIDGQPKCDVLVGRRPTAFETQTIRNVINKKWHVIPVQQTSLILHVLLRETIHVPVFAKLATPYYSAIYHYDELKLETSMLKTFSSIGLFKVGFLF